MRNAIGACALLVTVALAAGCDTEQPLQGGMQTVDITFSAPGASVGAYDTWVVFDDRNGNMISDDDYDGDGDPDEFLVCAAPQTGALTMVADTAPWRFAFETRVIRADGTESVSITSPASITAMNTVNLTPYDPRSASGTARSPLALSHTAGVCTGNLGVLCNPAVPQSDEVTCSSRGFGICRQAGTCTGDPSIYCDPFAAPASRICQQMMLGTCDATPSTVNRTIVFQNPRRLSGATSDVLASTTDPLFEFAPETACQGSVNRGVCIRTGPNAGRCSVDVALGRNGPICDALEYSRCPGQSAGPSRIDGSSPPFTFQIDSGDTVVVRARSLAAPSGFTPISGPDLLTSTFRVDGLLVSVDGPQSQPAADPGNGIDYFFTAR